MSLIPQTINFNNDGWGPINNEPKEIFTGIPFSSFSRATKIGIAADWTSNMKQHPTTRSLGHSSFNVLEDDEEDEYSLVDSRIYQKKTGFRRNYMKNQQRFRQHNNKPANKTARDWNQSTKTKGQRNVNAKTRYNRRYHNAYRRYGFQRSNRKFAPSVEIQPSWGEPLQTISWNTLQEARCELPTREVLASYGSLEKFNKQYSKVTVKEERKLDRHIERKFFTVTTSDDPVIEEMVKNNTGTVYATDAILAVLMSCLRSVYSWDLLVTKKDGKLIFDKRDDSQFDFLTVNENASDPPGDDQELGINSMESLNKEATFLNYSFSQQVLLKDGEKLELENPNPFLSTPEEKVASVGYRYCKFDMGDGIQVVVRTEVDGYKSKAGQTCMLMLKSLNEYDLKVTGSWRKKLETQKASAFATELKNNLNKLTKWLIQAKLADVGAIKLGYISRVNPKDQYNHTLLTITEHTPEEFQKELSIDWELLWGVLKKVVETLNSMEDGTYILYREPNKKQLLVYKVPPEEFFHKKTSK
jgi:translation initiation factor 3 subunit D